MSPRPDPRRCPRVALVAALALVAAACSSSKSPGSALHVPSPAWQEQVVYMVMTDRFANGDKTNDDQHRGEYDPTSKDRYSGGDLQGIIDKLDYVQGLGATAVWITPPVANMWWDPLQQSGGYHGYWARHLKKVDEHLGTLDTYKALSEALHKRGMYLIQDVVPNHMGNFFTYASYDPADPTKGFVRNTGAVPTDKPEQSPFDQDDVTDPAQRAAAIYHWTPAISDYADPVQELNYQVSDLDDLNTENPVVRKALRDAYGYWIKEVGVDAFRIDTVKYVPHDFWNDFLQSADPDAPGMMAVARATGRERFFAFGEVAEPSKALDDTADRKVASYHGTPAAPELPAVLEYPLYSDIQRVFAGGQPTSYLSYRLARFMDPALYPDPFTTPTFVDNHDNQRFLASGTRSGLAQALTFIFTIPGIPVVYYGTEQSFTETRAAMFAGGWKSDGDSYLQGDPYQRLKKLSALRRGNPVFTRGTLDVLYDGEVGPGPLAYRRTLGSETALVLMNTSDRQALFSGLETGLPAGTVLEVLHAEQNPPTPVVGTAGRIDVVLPGRALLVARATTRVVPPASPGATIAVGTPVEGQTFTADFTVRGTVSPPGTELRMVLDAALDASSPVAVAADGTFSAVVKVSDFPIGKANHALAFYAPAAGVSTPRLRFTSDLVFTGVTVQVEDPVGDDHGSAGRYGYPQDPTFGRQMDITSVKAEVGATTLYLHVTMADWSSVWIPPLGFDHVAFNLYFSIPGRPGVTFMPKLAASTPPGFAWSYNQFTYGWNNVMYTSDGASPTTYGTAVVPPKVRADGPSKTVTFTYDKAAFGLSTWAGVRVYVADWDFDGIGGNFRPLSPAGGQWEFSGGAPTDPMVMDDVPPITLPAPP